MDFREYENIISYMQSVKVLIVSDCFAVDFICGIILLLIIE